MTSTESAVTEPRDQEALPRPSALRWAVAASLVAGIAVMTAVVPLLASPVDESGAGEILFFVSRLLGGSR